MTSFYMSACYTLIVEGGYMKKKGFTLIELLAVIVILAVIALIATPAVLNIIEDSKKVPQKQVQEVL